MAKRNDKPQPPDREQIAAELAASMPADEAGLLAEAMAAVIALDAAVLADDEAAATAAGDRYEAAVWKLNGGTFFGCRADQDSAGRVIDRQCRAVPGVVPMWGQAGEFAIEVDGIRALVKVSDGFGVGRAQYSFYALDLDRPFISETGYRSHFDTLVAKRTVAEAATAIFAGYLATERRRKLDPECRDRLADDPLPSWCSSLVPPPVRGPATVQVPPGFVLVDVVLPKQKAFIARRWAEQAKDKIKAATAARSNAREKVSSGRTKPDPAPSKPTMSCSTVKTDDAERQRPAYWAGFKTGDRVRTKEVGTAGVFVLGDDKFIGYLVPDKLAGGVPNPDAGKASLRSHKFSVTPNELEHIQEPARASIVGNDDAEAVPFAPGMRCEIVSMHHPCFSNYIGKHVIIIKVHADTRQVWAHDDKPVTYRTNRAGRRVVDHDPRCIQSIYSFDQLRILT